MTKILIEGMEFFSYHGCFKEEQIIGTKFLVDMEIKVDVSEAEKTDDLSKTINYQTIYNLIKKEMEIKSKLLEHLGRRILDSVISNFPQATKIKVKVSKLNPPLGGKINSVSLIRESHVK